jgi:hypothetical protein
MNTRKPMPIGPLALALRHRGRRVAVLALLLGAVLLAGIVLLLR